jgi:hypothetical protein
MIRVSEPCSGGRPVRHFANAVLAPNEPSMREALGIKDEDEQQKTREKTA